MFLANLVATRSKEHLEALNLAYLNQHKNKKSAVKVIMEETSGDLKLALCAAFMSAAEVIKSDVFFGCFQK